MTSSSGSGKPWIPTSQASGSSRASRSPATEKARTRAAPTTRITNVRIVGGRASKRASTPESARAAVTASQPVAPAAAGSTAARVHPPGHERRREGERDGRDPEGDHGRRDGRQHGA